MWVLHRPYRNTRSYRGKVTLRATPGLPQGAQGSSDIGVTNTGRSRVVCRQRWSTGSKHPSKAWEEAES